MRTPFIGRSLLLGCGAAAALSAVPARADASTIKVSTTIQAAVDAASPGDTIVVPPGTYHEAVVVTTSDLTIRGSKSAVLDASGHTFGITVGTTTSFGPGPSCPAFGVSNFVIEGLTVENADDTGIFLFGVDGFRVSSGRYLDNASYGIFPRCSRNGLIEKNSGGGGDDATVYIGVDENVIAAGNKLTNGEIGIELEDTLNTTVIGNRLMGNTAGLLVVVLPELPRGFTEFALIERNVINKNNRPNPFPPPPPFTNDLQLLPAGTGILNVGGTHLTVRHNVLTNNDTVGVALVANPFGFPPGNDNQVIENTIMHNGESPDPRANAQGDIVYDGTGTGNCFAENRFKTDFPAGITSLFPCV